MIRRIWRIMFAVPLRMRPPLLPLEYRAVSGGKEIRPRRATRADYLVLGAGRARAVAEAQRLRRAHGDALAVLEDVPRRKRQRMPGWKRLYRRIESWAR